MEAENYLYDLLKKEEDGTYSISVAQRDSIGVNGWLKYFKDNDIVMDHETKETLKLEFVPVFGKKKIRAVKSAIDLDSEDDCHEPLKKFAQSTPEIACLLFDYFYDNLKNEPNYKFKSSFLLRKVGSSLKLIMRIGKNNKFYALLFQERTS